MMGVILPVKKQTTVQKISLSAIQQAAVLAQCLHVNRRSRSDEMSGMSVLNESSGLVVFHIYAWRIK